jgi:23S rRNA pseudouridine2457 synthase
VQHKCIRLIRIAIEEITLGDMQPGEVVEISEDQFFEKLHLNQEL